MNIRKDDMVKILLGKERGKTGKVVSVDRKKNRAVVDAKNIYLRHQRPRKAGEKGQKLQIPMSIHMSNLMVIDPSVKKPTRVGYRLGKKGIKERISKKTGKVI